MPTTVHSMQGDSLDAIVYRHYGDSKMVETVLEANPGLARHGSILPDGTAVALPDRKPAAPKRINLWD